MAEHLNVLQAAREAFIKSDAEDRVQKALAAKINCGGDVYQPGDEVWYLRGSLWRGPAKVLWQDNKVLFLRDGAFLARCSVNQVRRAQFIWTRQSMI